jgi:hypothetical protein
MTRGQTIAQAYAMRHFGTTFSVFFDTLLAPETRQADIAGGRFKAGVSCALFEESDDKSDNSPCFVPEFAECFLVGCAPVRW